MASTNRPEKTFRLGLISASVFANVRESNGEQRERTIRSVQLQRRFRDDAGWKSSTSFDLSSLPVAIEALRLALAYLVEQECSSPEQGEPHF